MAFSIGFEDPGDTDGLSARGRLELGSEVEYFESPLHQWSRQEYERHWLRSAGRLVERMAARFVVSIGGPNGAIVECWPAWPRADGTVLFQNHLILPELAREIDPSHPEPFVDAEPDLEPDEEGHSASTWCVPLDDVRTWLLLERG